MIANMGTADRILRFFAGLTLAALGILGVVGGTLGTALILVGVVLLVTSVVGWCPAYLPFGFSTNRTARPRPM